MSVTKLILLVDDDAEILRGLSVRLRAQGYTITTAADGKAGLEAASCNRPDLIVLDINMPVMDGFTMLAHLREDDALKETPVVMLSANVSEKMKREALKRGAQYFVQKPYDPQKLIATLKAAIADPAERAEICA